MNGILGFAAFGLLAATLATIPDLDHTQFVESKDFISFEKQVRPVIKNRCTQCHSAQAGLPDISDYEVAYELRFDIKDKVQTRKMPYFGKMKESERDLIIDWVNQGAKK